MDTKNNDHPEKNRIAGIKKGLRKGWAFVKKIYKGGRIPKIKPIADSRVGKFFSEGKGKRVWRICKRMLSFLIVHIRDHVINSPLSELTTIRDFWEKGRYGKIELSTVFAGGILLTTVLASNTGAEQGGVEASLLIACLFVFLFAYAFAMAALSTLPLWAYVLAGSYLLWFVFIIGGSLAFTIPMALPALWLLVSGWLKTRLEKGPVKFIWLVVLSWIVSYHTYGAFSLSGILDKDGNWVVILLLGLVYFLAGWFFLWALRKKTREVPYRPAVYFCGTLTVTAIFFILALLRDIQKTTAYAYLSMDGLLWVVLVIWMWLGATAVEGAVSTATWWTGESVKLTTKKVTRWLIPVMWIVTVIFSWLTTYAMDTNVLIWSQQTGITDWVLTWDDSLYFPIQFQFYVSLAVIVVWLICLIIKRLSDTFLSFLNVVWVSIFLVYEGFFQSLQGFADLSPEDKPNNWWLIFVLILGLAWEMAKAGEDYWDNEKPARHFSMASLLGFMLAVSAITLGAGSMAVTTEYTFYSFMGIMYFGIPMMIFILLKNIGATKLERGKLIILVLLGEISAVIPLVMNPLGDWSLLLGLLVWMLVLVVLGARLACLKTFMDAAFSGGALAVGFTTFWMYPEPIPLPAYLGFFQDIQNGYLSVLYSTGRPLLTEGHLLFSLVCLIFGICAGLMVFSGQKIIQSKQTIKNRGEK